jgi:cadmium resistance protein CadD (predicted permease)
MFANAILAMVTFIVTNVDDLLILTLYFSSPRFSKTQVVAGQFAGIAFLISISIAGALTGQLVLHHWTSLLGLMPMYLGIKGLLEKDQDMRDSKEQSRTTYQWLQVGMVTIANGSDNVGVYVPLFVKLSLSLIVHSYCAYWHISG